MQPVIAIVTDALAPDPDLEHHIAGRGSRVVVLDIISPKGGPMIMQSDRITALVVDQWGSMLSAPMSGLTVAGPAPVDWMPESLA